MKTKFTPQAFRYLSLIGLLFVSSLSLTAQTSHKVIVSSFQYSPKDLTITVGDTVIWTNSSGNHNVDGKTLAYPNNPVSFGNDLGTGWTYKFVFTTDGTYDYKCDPHAALGMVGKIVVNPKTVTSTQTLADGGENIHLYPNPASQYMQLMVPVNYAAISSVKVYTIAGTVVDEKVLSGNAESLRYDVSQFKNGIYLMEITAGNQRNVLKFIKQ
jgi:plastocyanin